MVSCRFTAQLTIEDTLPPSLPPSLPTHHPSIKGCISSLVRQQNVNQPLSHFTLPSQRCGRGLRWWWGWLGAVLPACHSHPDVYIFLLSSSPLHPDKFPLCQTPPPPSHNPPLHNPSPLLFPLCFILVPALSLSLMGLMLLPCSARVHVGWI